ASHNGRDTIGCPLARDGTTQIRVLSDDEDGRVAITISAEHDIAAGRSGFGNRNRLALFLSAGVAHDDRVSAGGDIYKAIVTVGASRRAAAQFNNFDFRTLKPAGAAIVDNKTRQRAGNGNGRGGKHRGRKQARNQVTVAWAAFFNRQG